MFCIKGELADAGWRAVLGIIDIASHAVVAAIMLVSIWCLEWAIHSLWSGSEPALFKGMGLFEIRLAWLFNAADIALIAVFSIKSVQIFWLLYSRRADPV
jgi:hypothetical protein